MDLKINALNFQGKKEVLYGLQKAAKIARASEYSNKAYTMSRMGMTKYEERAAYDASMKAYLDMALRDSEFKETTKKINLSELFELHEILKPEQTEHALVQPMNKFKSVADDVINSPLYQVSLFGPSNGQTTS
jgi:hypothetical protein